tara:strand:- start:25432 stop:25584 length:153 start_codon:yes stop_codon:yes gene_type:complete
MNFTDLKIYFYNTMALGISMTDVELLLKIVLLVCTIGYTISRWIHNEKNK